jgi:glycerol-3-phosphate dehydrogenase
VVLNYAPVDEVVREGDRAAGIEATCRWTGRRVRVRARCVINAAGPWVEAIRSLEDESAPPLLHLSKGIHIVLTADRLPVRNMVVLGTTDGRSIFAIRRGEVVYVGTTDTTYSNGAQGWPEITSEDVEYLLEPLPRHLEVEPVKPEEVVAAWAGLRPSRCGGVPTAAGWGLRGGRGASRGSAHRAGRTGESSRADRAPVRDRGV